MQNRPYFYMHVLWPIKLNIPLKLPSIPRYFCRIKKYHYNYLQLVEFFMFDLDFKFLSSTVLCVISFNTWNTFEWNTSVQEIRHSFLFLMSLMIVSLIPSYSQTNALCFTKMVLLNQGVYAIQLNISMYYIMFWTRD